MQGEIGMKNVYLIGDGVRYSTDLSIGYGIFVMEELEGEAYVYSPQADCGSAQHTLRYLHEWAAKAYVDPAEIDAVYWNNGLMDVERIMDDEPITPVDVYVRQLIRVHGRIRTLFPNAKVIFATTTPVLEQAPGGKRYRNADIEEYNRAAAEALRPLGVQIDDLYAEAQGFGADCWRSCEYFSEKGARRLAKRAAGAIRRAF